MKFTVVIFVSLLLMIGSCKKSSEANKVCFTRTQNELKIENNTNSQIYFTAFGQNILPLIDWAPICGNNYVPANNSISLSLSTVTGYSDNDKLVVYWWKCSGNSPNQMQTMELDRNQTGCK